MKNVFVLFFKKGNRKMGFAFLLFLIFFVVNLISLYQGIKLREAWRVWTAIAGALACITLCAVIVNVVVKAGKKEVPPAKTAKTTKR